MDAGESMLEADDLFSLASALADLLGAPVTIEDRDTKVLAYSDGQSSVDEARTATILGRRVPDRYLEALRAAGVFQRIASEQGVVYADLADADMLPRAIVGVRAHHELIGSVWAAMTEPPTGEQERALLEAAPIVAEHLLRDQSRRDVVRRTRVELVSALLKGGAEAVTARTRLGLPTGSLVIAALATPGPGSGDRGSSLRGERLSDALTLHLRAVEPRSVCALVGDRVYCVLRSDAGAARRILRDFVGSRADRAHLVAGIGRAVASADDVHRSRADADAVVGTLAAKGGQGVAASVDEVFLDLVTLRIADMLTAEGLRGLGPLPALAHSDTEHGTELVLTARAYLAHGGDVRAAAESLHVHPNTLRNRVRKARDACRVDLDDADTRLAVMLQLRAEELSQP